MHATGSAQELKHGAGRQITVDIVATGLRIELDVADAQSANRHICPLGEKSYLGGIPDIVNSSDVGRDPVLGLYSLDVGESVRLYF